MKHDLVPWLGNEILFKYLTRTFLPHLKFITVKIKQDKLTEAFGYHIFNDNMSAANFIVSKGADIHDDNEYYLK